jgi:glycosyltransferase involved in cell wall biosynthesis
MTRLAVFIPFSFGRGVERVNVTLAQALAARGVEVDVVAANSKGPYFDELNGKTRLVDLGVGKTVLSLPGLIGYLRGNRPKAILSAPDSGSLVALWARRLAGVDCRSVVATHAVLSRSLGQKSWLNRTLFRSLLHRTYRQADAVVAVSEQAADDLASLSQLPRADIQVIANPVVTDELERAAGEPAGHPWLENSDLPVILSVGRLNKEKNYEALISAFAKLRARCEARLIILGDGDEREALGACASELGVAEDVDLPGFVDNPYAFMAKADLLALSSHYEALPTVLIEAMACGCPVVAVDCPGGVREIVDHGRYGRLAPIGDADALADAMRATLETPPDPTLLKERSRDFHVDRIAERYRQVLGV